MVEPVSIKLNSYPLKPFIDEVVALLATGALPVEVAQRFADCIKTLLGGSNFFVSKNGGLPTSRAGGLFIDLEPSEPLCELLAAARAGDFDFVAICERHGLTPSVVGDVCGNAESTTEGALLDVEQRL